MYRRNVKPVSGLTEVTVGVTEESQLNEQSPEHDVGTSLMYSLTWGELWTVDTMSPVRGS